MSGAPDNSSGGSSSRRTSRRLKEASDALEARGVKGDDGSSAKAMSPRGGGVGTKSSSAPVPAPVPAPAPASAPAPKVSCGSFVDR
jgi:hypothetical protein